MSREDEIYKRAYDQGREGWLLDDFSFSLGRGFNITKDGEIWDKGYEQGQKDRAKFGRRKDQSTSSIASPSAAADDDTTEYEEGGSSGAGGGVGDAAFLLLGAVLAVLCTLYVLTDFVLHPDR